jgi:NAD(P)H dehydrogenase (quinone)
MATSLTSSASRDRGRESTLIGLTNTFYRWGSLMVPRGYTHAIQNAADRNPYGTSYPSELDGDPAVTAEALTAAHYQRYPAGLGVVMGERALTTVLGTAGARGCG